MTDGRVLLVKDPFIGHQTFESTLNKKDYQVSSRDGALELLGQNSFDLIVVHLQLHESKLLDYCREIKQSFGHIPLMLVGQTNNGLNATQAYQAGVDDFLNAEMDPKEFEAQANARIRLKMSVEKNCNIYRFGDVFVDLQNLHVYRQGKFLKLSGMSLNLLRYFIEHHNEVLTRPTLLRAVWGYCGTNITRTVDMHVSKLRKKMEHDPRNPQHFLTIQGKGYKFIR